MKQLDEITTLEQGKSTLGDAFREMIKAKQQEEQDRIDSMPEEERNQYLLKQSFIKGFSDQVQDIKARRVTKFLQNKLQKGFLAKLRKM